MSSTTQAMTPPETAPRRSVRQRQLFVAGIAFGVASAVHIADHMRRGQGSTTDLLLNVGTSALVVQTLVVTLVVTRHRLAPVVAAASGPALAIGFAAAHWLPRWSDLSDPVWEIEPLTALSVVASSAEILTAVVLGLAGYRAWTERVSGPVQNPRRATSGPGREA